VSGAFRLASYKLRFHEERVRAVPARDEAGCPFAGPGVDLSGDDARSVLALASPFRDWLHAREPGVALRTLSVDLGARRVIVTLAPMTPDQRPRVVRIDPPHADELLVAAAPIDAVLCALCIHKLRQRAAAAGDPSPR
jgi:hypothetical protein